MEHWRTIARQPAFVAVSLCGIAACVWIVLAGPEPPPDRGIANVAVSRSGRWLAAGTGQGRITVWDRKQLESRRQIRFPHGRLNDLQFGPDEHLLAIASEDIGVLALQESAVPRLLRSDRENYGSARFSPDGQSLLVITGAGKIETIALHSGAPRVQVCCSSIYGEAVFTPDGQSIANAGHWPRLWDARTGQLIGPLAADREFSTFRPIAFDAGRGAVFMGSQDGRVYAWDLKTRQRIAVSPAQSGYVDTLAVSSHGWVVFAAFGNSVELWNPDTGQHRSLPAARPASNVIAGPDDSILFGTASGTVEWWDLEAGQRLQWISVAAF